MFQKIGRLIWAEERIRVEIAKISGYRASVRGFHFPSHIFSSSESWLIHSHVGKFWSSKGDVWDLKKDTNQIFHCIVFPWEFASAYYAVVGNYRELWSAESSLAQYEVGFRSIEVVAQLLLPYHPPESFALIPRLALEQDALGALGSCGPVADLSLPSTTLDCSWRKRAAEGLDKPEPLIQHRSSAASPCAAHSFSVQLNDPN